MRPAAGAARHRRRPDRRRVAEGADFLQIITARLQRLTRRGQNKTRSELNEAI
jgi:hypothetical protein